MKNNHWYIGFTTNTGKKYLPVHETDWVRTYFPYLTRPNRCFRGTIQFLRKGRNWYIAVPIQLSCDIQCQTKPKQTPIGIDVGLRHLAVVLEPQSGKRQFFSGKEVGYRRRHFRSLRWSLGKKKAQRAMKRLGQKEKRVRMSLRGE
jgi:putative transposase